MADENAAGEGQGSTESSGQDGKDWQALYEAEKAAREKAEADSRKWESRSKANVEKARKWDAATAGEESIEDRIAALEADKKALEDERARGALVAKVAAATGVPESIVATLNGADEAALTSQAKAVTAAYKPAGAPSAPEAGRFPKGVQPDEQLKFVRELMGK